MLHLHYSNRFEELISPLRAEVRAAQSSAPLDPVTIIVPGRAVEEFLKLRLAESEGVAANLHFPFLRRYLTDAVERASKEVRVLDLDELQIVIFEFLRKASASNDSDFRPVRSYIAAAPDPPRHREFRLFQLGARVAWLFREYSILRRPMLERWSRGLSSIDGLISPSERWQRRVYTGLFDHDGCLKPEWTIRAEASGGIQRWMMLPDAFASTDPKRLRETLPACLHLFGLGYAGPEFLKIFGRLGDSIDLHIYALNPCQEFWEDVQDARVVRRPARPRPPRVGAALTESEDPFGLESGDDNMALRRWGRAGREYIRLLNELSDCDFDSHFRSPLANERTGSLLAQVQQMILLRRSETALPADGRSRDDDGSIRFLLCPSVRREVEIVANAIWSLIRRGDEGDRRSEFAQRLRFHQIAVVIPDSCRDAYLPHIESVFAHAHEIPLNLMDRGFTASSRVVEAVELLLKLPLGRFSRHELTRLITHPAISGSAFNEDSERWREWCRSLGVYFGADETAFSGTYIPSNLYHWDQALKRLALGLFMESGPGERRVFSAGEQREYLPYEIPEDAADAAAVMARTIRGLLCDAQELAKSERPFAGWSKVLCDLVSTYVHPRDRDGERARDLIVQVIDAMAPEGLASSAVSYEVAAELALERIAGGESEQAVYAEGGVVVGSLSALRSIPFRVIFMVGMGEANFPERERRDPLDLRQAQRMPGDVSPAERDRYMFLETLLAARDRFFISYVARNAQTGDRLEPSPVVRDLQSILRSLIADDARERLCVEHPVSNYDRRYFADLANTAGEAPAELETFDRNARCGAQIAAMRKDLEARCGPVVLASEKSPLEGLAPGVRTMLEQRLRIAELPELSARTGIRELVLPITALRRYLECPLQGAARYALGLLDQENDAQEDADEEPVDEPFLERITLLREALWRGRGDREQVERVYRSGFRYRELQGIAPTGTFAQAAHEEDLKKLTLSLGQAAKAGIVNLDGWQRIAFGGASQFVEVERTVPPLILEVDVQRPDGTAISTVALRGTVGPFSPGLECSIKCVAGREAKPHDFLEGFLGAIVLAAAGEKMPASFTAIAVGGDKDGDNPKKFSRSFHPPGGAEGRDYLTMLASDLLSDENDYFLPIEAVSDIVAHDRKGERSIKEAIDKIRDNEIGRCRSDYGPVADARSFAPCAPGRAREIVDRRFGLIRAIFEK